MTRIRDGIVFAYVMGILGSIAWGISFIGSKTALDYLEPMQVMAVRMTVALLAFLLIIGLKLVKVDFRGKKLRSLLFLSLAQPCLYATFEIYGIDLTTASESAILLSIVPIVVTLVYAVGFREKIRLSLAAFILLSFSGVIVTVLGDIATSGKVLGYLLLMMAVACASAFTVLSKEISGRFTSIEITFIMTLCGFIFFNGSSLLMGHGLEAYRIALREPELLGALVFLGVVCSVFAFIAYNQLIGKVPAYKASTVSLSILTVTGVVAGILLRGEPITLYKIAGLVMILTGVVGASRPEELPAAQAGKE
jgi:drug/metabolite transporter (DMT)-like permease